MNKHFLLIQLHLHMIQIYVGVCKTSVPMWYNGWGCTMIYWDQWRHPSHNRSIKVMEHICTAIFWNYSRITKWFCSPNVYNMTHTISWELIGQMEILDIEHFNSCQLWCLIVLALPANKNNTACHSDSLLFKTLGFGTDQAVTLFNTQMLFLFTFLVLINQPRHGSS